MQEFESRLEDCLAVNDNPNVLNEDDPGTSEHRIIAPVVKRIGRGGAKSAKKVQPKRGRKPVAPSSDSSSGSENHPPRRQKGGRKIERRIVESDSDEEPAVQKRTTARAVRSTKVVQESTSSGKKRLSENNSF